MSPIDSTSATEAGLVLPDAVMRALVADELDRIRSLLEDMGMQLCADPDMVRRHMNVLQSVDEICQRNENLARTLRATDMIAEAGSITLETLRVRFQDAIAERLSERSISGDVVAEETWHDI
jgi:hypothetical protein